jgi:hypothetical protein
MIDNIEYFNCAQVSYKLIHLLILKVASMVDYNNNVLLLGMVFSDQLTPSRGQEFRDRVRCVELQELGFNVFTVDDKHADDYNNLLFPGKHCNANFNNERGLLNQIQAKWGTDVKFSHIILDYFFSPIGWARTRWLPSFFSKTIPSMATMTSGGMLWLPHLRGECYGYLIYKTLPSP